MEIDVQSSVSQAPASRRTRALLSRAARALKESGERGAPKSGEVSVLFCGDRRIRTLNRRYRGVDRSTDVLAFPAAGFVLGDIVVSVPYATRQALARGEPPARELDRLLLHGYLHLLGYDHETDDGQMEHLESRLRRRLKIDTEKSRS